MTKESEREPRFCCSLAARLKSCPDDEPYPDEPYPDKPCREEAVPWRGVP